MLIFFCISIAGTAIGLTKKVPLSMTPAGSPRGTTPSKLSIASGATKERGKSELRASILERLASYLVLFFFYSKNPRDRNAVKEEKTHFFRLTLANVGFFLYLCSRKGMSFLCGRYIRVPKP